MTGRVARVVHIALVAVLVAACASPAPTKAPQYVPPAPTPVPTEAPRATRQLFDPALVRQLAQDAEDWIDVALEFEATTEDDGDLRPLASAWAATALEAMALHEFEFTRQLDLRDYGFAVAKIGTLVDGDAAALRAAIRALEDLRPARDAID